ncbi:membrane protein insertase YidC [Parafilimonas sp.]|uniref:membrane protein insertase YidC n=1 Tax=Parafilimonas sp. TaxID=1969739 RepID=UPI0039E268D8
MKDKNTIIGIVLLAILFFVFFWYTNKQQGEYVTHQKRIQDSLRTDSLKKITPEQKAAFILDSLRADSIGRANAAGNFANTANVPEQLVTVENDLIKAVFTTKGGAVKYVELKHYNSSSGGKVVLGESGKDGISYAVNTGANKSALTTEMNFVAGQPEKNADGSQTIQFKLTDAAGAGIIHQYTIKQGSYLIDWNISLTGAQSLITNNTLNFHFVSQPMQVEKSADYERRMTNVCFSEGNDFDYISSKTEHKFEKPVQWVSAAQQFFNVALIAKDNFKGGEVHWARSTDTTQVIGLVDASLQMQAPASASVNIPMQLYYGPNDYKILQNAAPEMDGIVNLGRDFYAFVRPINKYIIMPVFNFFAGFISVYGWVIALLTIFIRLVTSPLVYRSYKSGARMKLLRPELDELRKKFGTDQQGFAMEQMKLFREAGVNPLGGCLPLLLQIPIFFALYSFFNSNISLRGQPFLWSKDLSTYDILVQFGSKIFVIGDHISLFALLAVATSFLISVYNMNMTPQDPNNPALKYMPYIYPVFMLLFFNSLPAALTWYYTVSNLITLGIQFTIQNYILDHDKILAQMHERRKAPKVKPKSKWQEQYEKMLEAQKKVQQMKDQQQKNKK